MSNWEKVDVPSSKGVDWSKPIFKDAKTKKVEKILLDGLNTDIVVKRPNDLRISKLPICGLIYALGFLEDKRKTETLSDEYYTRIGNAVHDFYQYVLPRGKSARKVFGNWKCESCNHLVERTTTPEGLICPKCRSNRPTLKYSEIEVSYKRITGHIDMIFYEDGIYSLLDWKTTGVFSIQNPRYLPQPKHLMQAESYCFMIEEQYGIKISNYFIDYVSRDKKDGGIEHPDQLKNSQLIGFDVTPKILKRRKNQLDQIIKSRQTVKRLFDNPTVELLEELNENRPCHSMMDYENRNTGMTHHFFGKEECPYVESCTSGKKWTKPAKRIWKLLD